MGVIFSVINKCFMHSAYTVSMPYRSNAKLQLKFFYTGSCVTQFPDPQSNLKAVKANLMHPFSFFKRNRTFIVLPVYTKYK